MEIIDIITEYEKWCNSCKYEGLSEALDPCNDCLEASVNQNSEKPVCYEPKTT